MARNRVPLNNPTSVPRFCFSPLPQNSIMFAFWALFCVAMCCNHEPHQMEDGSALSTEGWRRGGGVGWGRGDHDQMMEGRSRARLELSDPKRWRSVFLWGLIWLASRWKVNWLSSESDCGMSSGVMTFVSRYQFNPIDTHGTPGWSNTWTDTLWSADGLTCVWQKQTALPGFWHPIKAHTSSHQKESCIPLHAILTLAISY